MARYYSGTLPKIALGDVSTARFPAATNWTLLVLFEMDAADSGVSSLVSKHGNITQRRQFMLRNRTNKKLIAQFAGTEITTGPDLVNNRWYLGVCTCDTSNNIAIYCYELNGTLMGSATGTHPGDVSDLTASVNIGADDNDTYNPLGTICHVMYIDKVLTTNQRLAYMRNPTAFAAANNSLVRFYLPLTGTSSPENDWSGNGHSGTISGTVVWGRNPPIQNFVWFNQDIHKFAVLGDALKEIISETANYYGQNWQLKIDHEENVLPGLYSLLTNSSFLAVNGSANLFGSYGLEVTFDGENDVIAQKDFTLLTANSYRAFFKFDPNSANLDTGKVMVLLELANGNDHRVRVQLRSGPQLQMTILDDNATTNGGTNINITDAPHDIEFLVTYATSAVSNDGIARFFIDGVEEWSKTDLDLFSTSKPNRIFWGLFDIFTGTYSGSIYLDHLIIRNSSDPILNATSAGVLSLRDMNRIANETVNISEVLVTVIGYVRLLNETINISEALITAIGYVNVLDETINISESILRNTGFTRILNEYTPIGHPRAIIDHEDISTLGAQWDNVDPSPPTLVTPGLNGTTQTAHVGTTETGFISKDIPTSVTRIRFKVQFYLDMGSLGDTPSDVLMLRIFAASQSILVLQFLIRDGDASNKNLYGIIREDGGGTSQTAIWGASKSVEHLIDIRITKASSNSASDALLEIRDNGVLKAQTTGLDLFDNMEDIDEVMFGEAPDAGDYEFDEIIIAEDEPTDIIAALGLVRVLLETINISETIVKLFPLLVRVIDETINITESLLNFLTLVRILEENTELRETPAKYFFIDHETGDFTQYDTAPSSATIQTPGLNGTGNKARFDTTSIDFGSVVLPGPIGTVMVVEFFIDITLLTSIDASGFLGGFRLEQSSGFRLVDTQIQNSPAQLRVDIQEDGGSTPTTNFYTLNSGVTRVQVRVIKASSAVANNGIVELYFDGLLQEQKTGLDIFDAFAAVDELKIGIISSNISGSGDIDLDEIRYYEESIIVPILGYVRLLNETVNINESILRFLQFVRIIDETVNITELILNLLPLLLKIIDETINILETLFPIRGLIRIRTETVNIVEVIVRLTGLLRILDETIHILLIGDGNIEINHETGGITEWTNPPIDADCYAIVQPGLNGTIYGLQIAATTSVLSYFEKVFVAPTGNSFELTFWLDLSCFTMHDATTEILTITDATGVTNVLRVRPVIGTGEPTGVTFYLYNDTAGLHTITVTTDRTLAHKWRIVLHKASTNSSNDGIFQIYLDGVLQTGALYTIDLFDNWANLTNLRVGMFNIVGMDGHYIIDEIRLNTISNTAIYILQTAISLIINEQIPVNEKILRLPPLIIKLIAETINITEIPLNVKDLLEIIVETLNILDVGLRISGLTHIIDEIVNISELIVKLLNLIHQLDETVNVSEGLFRLTSFSQIINEIINISETSLQPRVLLRIDDDDIFVTDTVIKTAGWIRLISETINLPELQLGPLGLFVHIIDETINISEIILRRILLTRITEETVNISEVSGILNSFGLIRLINENIDISELVLQLVTYLRVINETVQIREGVISPQSLVKLLNEIINISEVVLIRVLMIRTILETVTITENSVIGQGLVRAINETINIVEQLLNQLRMTRSITETIEISDITIHLRDLVRVLNDYILINENIIRGLGLVKSIGETVNISETLRQNKIIIQLLFETLNITEIISGSPILYLISDYVERAGIRVVTTTKGTNLYQLARYGLAIITKPKGIKIYDEND